MVTVAGQRCPKTGKVTVGLASHWPCVTDFKWFISLRAQGLSKGDEHPTSTLHGVWYSLPFLRVQVCNPTPTGRQYIGHVSVTETGKPCQAWASQTPNSHGYTEDYKYPDGSVSAASNYCRNPSISYVGLWCYTTDPEARWEDCDVPLCPWSVTELHRVQIKYAISRLGLSPQAVKRFKCPTARGGSPVRLV